MTNDPPSLERLMIRRILAVAGLAVLAACGDTELPTAPEFEPVQVNATAESMGYVALDLGAPDGSSGTFINDAGQVLVECDSRVKGSACTGTYWLWTDGLLEPVSLTSGSGLRVIDLNASGQLLVSFGNSSGQPRGGIWQAGAITELTPLPGHTDTYVYGFNEAGQVIGVSFGGSVTATFWDPAGAAVEIDLDARPFDINQQGQILLLGATGWFLWEDGVSTAITAPGTSFRFTFLNDRGEVAGTGTGLDGLSKVFFGEAGNIQAISLPPDMASPSLLGLNDAGQMLVRARNTVVVESVYYLVSGETWTRVASSPGRVRIDRRRPKLLNDLGEVVLPALGPSIWDLSGSTPLPALDGAVNAGTFSLSNDSQVTGQASIPNSDGTVARRPVLWRELTPVEAIEAPKAAIEDAVAAGDIDAGNGNALTSKLNTATAMLNDGKTVPALNKLQATINQLNAMMPNKLDPAIGQPLVDQIQALIDALS